MQFIRKHAATLTVLTTLLAAFAAPYLIPENPDSAVFRSGALSCVLLLGAAYPAWDALRRANRRTLVCGLTWGLLLACALGLGAELLAYNSLLSGMGSLLRRLDVPVMATPLLGLLCARLMLAAPGAGEAARPARMPLWGYMLILLLCWLPVWLAYFPGMLNYDFPGEYGQHLESSYSTLHPLLHSALVNAIITLGELAHSRTFGLFLMTALQMALFAAALAYACVFAQKRGAPRTLLAAMTAESLLGFEPKAMAGEWIVFMVLAFYLLADCLRRARADERLAAMAGRMHLQPGEATLVLGQLPQAPHLVYLDPMFPAKGKAALTKKKLQLFQRLEPPCAQEEELLAAALAAGPRRVVVKRPLKAPALAGRKPSHSVEGKTIRYDVFVPAR